MKALSKLKKLLKNHNLDAYVIPKNDEFFGEYAFPNRLKTISNFSGSAGFAVITCSINYLFVDGRYLIQSKIESGRDFKIIEIPYTYPKDIINNNLFKRIGYDPKLFTATTLERYFGYKYNKTANVCPIHWEIWQNSVYCLKNNPMKRKTIWLSNGVWSWNNCYIPIWLIKLKKP